MTCRFYKSVATIALLAALTLPTSTLAAVVFYSTAFSLSDGVDTPVGVNFTGTLSDSAFLTLPRFDPSFGTLQSVEIAFQSDYEVAVRGIATDERGEFVFFPFGESNDAGVDASVEGSLRIRLFNPLSPSATLDLPLVNTFCYETSEGGLLSCIAQEFSQNNTYDGLVPMGTLGLLDFVGTSSLTLLTSLNATFFGACDGDDLADSCNVEARTSWSGLAGVTYTYALDGGGDPPGDGDDGNLVPEPDTSLLIAMGLALLGLVRRWPLHLSDRSMKTAPSRPPPYCAHNPARQSRQSIARL